MPMPHPGHNLPQLGRVVPLVDGTDEIAILCIGLATDRSLEAGNPLR